MFDRPEILTMAAALSSRAALRQSVIAANVANADTPGYRAKDLPRFSEIHERADGFRLQPSRYGHLGGGPAAAGEAVVTRASSGAASPNGNTVSLEGEMVEAAGVKRDHDIALAVYRSSLDILRASLGRR